MTHDQSNDDGRTKRTVASLGDRFVRRLIPTVAAASLSFTGCIPGGGNNGNNGNNGNLDGGNRIDADAATDDVGSDTNNGFDVLDTSDIVQRRDVRDTQTDDSGPDIVDPNDTGADTGTSDANSDTTGDGGPGDGTTIDAADDTTDGGPSTDTGGDGGTTTDTGGDGGSTGTPLIVPNDDGTVSSQEISDLCQAFSQCDPQYFSQSYSSVADCAQSFEQNVTYYINYYEQYYSSACADEFEAFVECQLGQAICLNGQVDYDYYSGVDCYSEHDYYSICNP
jgi:hypothetical protein